MTIYNIYIYIYIYIYIERERERERERVNGPGDLCSIPGRVMSKTQKIVPDASLLNTQHYKVRVKCKVEQSRERSSAHPQHLGVVAIEKGASGSLSTTAANFTYLYIYIYIYGAPSCPVLISKLI